MTAPMIADDVERLDARLLDRLGHDRAVAGLQAGCLDRAERAVARRVEPDLGRAADRLPGDGGVEVSTRRRTASTAPTAAVASRPAVRAIALLTAEAMPASLSSASASTVAVSGATVTARPSEYSASEGTRSPMYDVDSSIRSISRKPPATRHGPTAMNQRGP